MSWRPGPRKKEPSAFMTPDVLKLEAALLKKASDLDAEVRTEGDVPSVLGVIRNEVARQFRGLAEEMHYW